MQTIIDAKKVKSDRDLLRDGLKILAAVGIVSGVYGYRVGRRVGVNKAFEMGYLAASKDFIESLNNHTLALRDSQSKHTL